MIFGIALGILLPSIYIFYDTAAETQDMLLYTQIDRIGKNILSTSRSIYYSGEYSRDSITIDFPVELISIKIYDNHEMVLYFNTDRGEDSLVLWSDISLKTNIEQNPPGSGIYLLTPEQFNSGQGVVKIISEGDIILLYLEGYSG
jgi:hypothetical protein